MHDSTCCNNVSTDVATPTVHTIAAKQSCVVQVQVRQGAFSPCWLLSKTACIASVVAVDATCLMNNVMRALLRMSTLRLHFLLCRDNYLLPAYAEAIAMACVRSLNTAWETLIFGTLVYWMIGYTASAGKVPS